MDGTPIPELLTAILSLLPLDPAVPAPCFTMGMMDEHINASVPFKGVRINTSYSYGIDDQEFVVSFDSDYPQEFVDLVHRLRYTEASMFTLQDTPMFTCVKKDLAGVLDDLG